MGRLDGKIAFITAAGGAIAGETARRFAAEGAAVACIDIVEETVNKTAADIEAAGGSALPLLCDVTDEEAVKAAIGATVATYGGLTTVFNAAAYADPLMPLEELDVETWRMTLDVGVTGMFIVAKYAIPHMRAAGGGSFINISSIYGARVAKKRPAYSAAKAAVRLLTQSIAVDYAADNIRANAILPGPIETPRLLVASPSMEAVVDRHRPHLPAARLGQPAEIAATAVFLASDEASYTSGADHYVDGGFAAV
jgi:NAD(P)-dependent dehydrogenase (short-subunit alcohol dehydrogenase family)